MMNTDSSDTRPSFAEWGDTSTLRFLQLFIKYFTSYIDGKKRFKIWKNSCSSSGNLESVNNFTM